jgi:hypothetical protein
MQDTKSARDLPSDPAWRDFVPRPSLNMTTVVRPFAPLLAREAAFAWLGGVSARPKVIQEDSDTQMSVACSDSECEQTCCTTHHSASQLNSQAGSDRIEAHSPVVNATRDVARIAAAHVVPVLVAGLEHESNTNAALEALQALGHKWKERAHANLQLQPLLCCSYYEMDLSETAMQHRYKRARTKLLQAVQAKQQLPADLYSMLLDSAKVKLSPSGALLLHEIAAMCLRCTHGAGVSMRSQKRWTLEEKAQLAGGERSVENRTSNAVWSVRKRDGTEQASKAAFPKAIFSAESASMEQTDATAPQQLHTKTWRKIDAAKRLPDGAEVDWTIGVARIPKTWTLTLPRKALFVEQLQSSPEHEGGGDIVMRDIDAKTKVSAILDHVRSVLKRRFPRQIGMPAPALYVQKLAPPLQAPEPSTVVMPASLSPSATGATAETEESPECNDEIDSLTLIPPSQTVEGADLFNKQDRLAIVCGGMPSYSAMRRANNESLHNERPKAPAHIGMVNNLTGASHRPKPTVNLVKQQQIQQVATHLANIAHEPLARCCFQCGMLNYPSEKQADIITVDNVHRRQDCRAYRVFKHYIKARASRIRRKLRVEDPTATMEDSMSHVFLCEPDEENGGSRVYTCTACKSLCRTRTDDGTRYVQCDPTELDLFDGHDVETGEYESIGIGDKQPKVYKRLTVHDRLTLSVLKVRLSHSKKARRLAHHHLRFPPPCLR